MYRLIADFRADYAQEAAMTEKMLGALTDASLEQCIVPGGRTLGFLAWHITHTVGEMLGLAGVQGVQGPDAGSAPPTTVTEHVRAYRTARESAAARVCEQWTDADLPGLVAMYGGEEWSRGTVLSALIRHEAHHRGQMTVLMRQAGLAVPGTYGPSREEWAAMGAPVPR